MREVLVRVVNEHYDRGWRHRCPVDLAGRGGHEVLEWPSRPGGCWRRNDRGHTRRRPRCRPSPELLGAVLGGVWDTVPAPWPGTEAVPDDRQRWSSSLDVVDTTWSTGVAWITVGCCVAACVPSGLRWLRVAQREHYLAGSVSPVRPALVAMTPSTRSWPRCPGAAGASVGWPVAGVATPSWWRPAARPLLPGEDVAAGLDPAPRALAAVWAALEAVVVVLGVAIGPVPLAGWPLCVVPLLVDLPAAITAPLERRLAAHYVAEAAARLRRVAPTVVAITGPTERRRPRATSPISRPPGRWWPRRPASTTGRAWPGP